MSNQNFPSEVIEAIKDSVDCNLYFFGTQVSESMMYMILVGTVLLLLVIYVLLNMLHGTKEK